MTETYQPGSVAASMLGHWFTLHWRDTAGNRYAADVGSDPDTVKTPHWFQRTKPDGTRAKVKMTADREPMLAAAAVEAISNGLLYVARDNERRRQAQLTAAANAERRASQIRQAGPALLAALESLLAAWDAVGDHERVPDALNDPALWANARAVVEATRMADAALGVDAAAAAAS